MPSDRPADSRLMTTPVITSRPSALFRKDACLIQIYPTGLSIGTRYPLNEQDAIIGRDDDCDITVHDPPSPVITRVSRSPRTATGSPTSRAPTAPSSMMSRRTGHR